MRQFLNLAFRAASLRPSLSASLLGLALILGSAAHASASSLQIQFTGLDLHYDGTNLFDAQFPNTVGNGDPAQSDALSSMSFYLDGTQVGPLLSTDIFADIYLADVLNIPVGGGVLNSLGNGGAFGIDLLTQNALPGWGLALDINTMQFFYTGSKIAVSVSGLATHLSEQTLPFGLQFDPSQPITIVVASADLTNVTTAGGYLTGFDAAGTGNIAGTENFNPIPEPSALASMMAALIGFFLVGRRGGRFRSG